MSKIGEWLENRLVNNTWNLPQLDELLGIIDKYYGNSKKNMGVCTYKDMLPDDLWVELCRFLDVVPSDVEGMGTAMEDMLEKLTHSTWSYEYFERMKK